ncbi:caspase-7-like isoform X2 [Sitophilus oryzae]|uniref:Caspase-7-like isoform X2 n=1 Tax=Sitophilus oryzae TaxID=7048 RepID=A0A6J2YDN2_SITOR|nr:caspase-7-like isoform X2 [Sitophilus oryzae]
MDVQTDVSPMTGEQIQSYIVLGAQNNFSAPNQINTEEQTQNVLDEIPGERFQERHHLNLDTDFDYPRKGTDPGIVLIFNNETFSDEPRLGSRRDVNEILICFSRLGFNIHESDVCTDYSAERIQNKIAQILNDKERLKNTNCLVVFVMTHGEEYEMLNSLDGWFRTKDIWKHFMECEELEDKPKLFFIQACKGYFSAKLAVSTAELDKDKQDKPPLIDHRYLTPGELGPDMLIAYSTIEGNVSFRDPQSGSWFIQELCKNFSTYGRREDVVSLMTRINKCVCRNYYTIRLQDIAKQTPAFVSTLSKKFYLNRNKDRHILLQIQKDTDEINGIVKEIMNCLNNRPSVA